MNVHNRIFTQIYPQNIAKFNSKQRIRFAIGYVLHRQSCYVRVAIDATAITLFRSTFSSAYANTIFDEWTYALVSLIFTFQSVFRSMRFGETLSLIPSYPARARPMMLRISLVDIDSFRTSNSKRTSHSIFKKKFVVVRVCVRPSLRGFPI